MGYIVKLISKDESEILGSREWLCYRYLGPNNDGYTKSTRAHATVFETKDEISSEDIQYYLKLNNYDFVIEES